MVALLCTRAKHLNCWYAEVFLYFNEVFNAEMHIIHQLD